jgi:hypothetical protein
MMPYTKIILEYLSRFSGMFCMLFVTKYILNYKIY